MRVAASNKNDLIDFTLGKLGILQHSIDRIHAFLEVIHAKILKASASDGCVVVDTVVQRVDLNVSLRRRRECPLGTFTGSTKSSHCSLVVRHVLLELALEVLQEVIDHSVIEIFSTKMGISSRRLDFKDSILNGEKRDIEGTTTKIKDQDVLLCSLLVETIRNRSSSRFVDDAHHIQSTDCSGILGCLTLSIVEIGRYSNDCILDLLSKIVFGNLLHLAENHGRDFFGLELFGFSLELNLNQWSSIWTWKRP